MHRLNASQITAFPEQQKSNKCKNSLLCFLYMGTCELLVVVKGTRTHHQHAVVRLRACVCVCLCAWQTEGGRIKETEGQTSVTWSLTSSTPDGGSEEDEVGRQRTGEGRMDERLEQILPPTDRPGCTRHRLRLIRARDASYGPPAHLQPVNRPLINHC